MDDMGYTAQVPFRARDVYLDLRTIEERGERLRERRSTFLAFLGFARRAFARLSAATA